jgi:hypothetical protein
VQALSPWSPAESLRLGIIGVLGTAAIGAAWLGSANQPSFHGQVRWMIVATAGFVVVSYSAVSWLMRARHIVLERRQLLLPLAADEPRSAPLIAAQLVVVGPEPARYHRPGCALAKGRGWPEVRRADADVADRTACGVCRP